MGLLVGVSCLLSLRRWSKRRLLLLAGATAAILLLHLYPLLITLTEGGKTVTYVMQQHGGGQAAGELGFLAGGWHRLTAHLREGHPVLLFLGVAGLAVVPTRGVGLFFAPIILGLAFLTGWGDQLVPNLELDRSSIPLLFAAIPPAAIAAERLLSASGPWMVLTRAALIAMLALGGYNTSRIYKNRGLAPYVTISDEMKEIVGWLRANVPEDGRVMIAGHAVHGYGGGHVAYLPVLIGREMMACDYYAFPPSLVEYDYPPRAYRRDDNRYHQFLDLYNVTHIMTIHDHHKNYLRSHPEWYEEVVTHERKCIFRVKREPNSFLSGSGEVEADIDRLNVTLDSPQPEVVLKYNWAEGLTSDPGVELFPHSVDENIVFIGVRPGERSSFSIRYNRWL